MTEDEKEHQMDNLSNEILELMNFYEELINSKFIAQAVVDAIHYYANKLSSFGVDTEKEKFIHIIKQFCDETWKEPLDEEC